MKTTLALVQTGPGRLEPRELPLPATRTLTREIPGEEVTHACLLPALA